jgi:hypothetical protein
MFNTIKGARNFGKDIKLMTGKNLCTKKVLYWYWIISWKFISPIACAVLVVISFIQYEPMKLNNYQFPVWVRISKLNCYFLF